MNIEQALLSEQAKKNTTRIVHFIGTDPQRFDALMKCFFSNDKALAQRAVWVVA